MEGKIKYYTIDILIITVFFSCISWLGAIQASAKESQFFGRENKEFFDSVLNILYRDHFKGNSIITGQRKTLPIEVRKSEPFAINAPKDARYPIAANGAFGYFVVISNDLKRVYIDLDRDFKDCSMYCVGEMIKEFPGWCIMGIDKKGVHLSHSLTYFNTRLIEVLLRMYQMTGENDYRNKARNLILGLIARVYTDGRFYLTNEWFKRAYQGPRYRGMTQAIIMHTLNNYLKVMGNDKEIYDALIRICKSFYHTTEGCNDHWTNSVMGIFITDELLNLKTYSPSMIDIGLNRYVKSIREHEGTISNAMKPLKKYPLFKATYQTYNALLLARISLYYFRLDRRNKVKDIMEMVMQKSLERKSIEDFANNLLTCYYLNELHWPMPEKFIKQARIIVNGWRRRDLQTFPNIWTVNNATDPESELTSDSKSLVNILLLIQCVEAIENGFYSRPGKETS